MKIFNIYLKKKVILIMLIIINTGCAVNAPKPCIKNGKAYGVYNGMFRGKWWNYYQVAVSYTDGICLEDAENAFKKALEKNDSDERDAVTYGMHRINYFPHRELGIIYYYQKKYNDAIKELELSINNEKSGRAIHYLNKSRRSLVLSKEMDKDPPRIIINKPNKNNRITSNYYYLVTGDTIDNTFVNNISINGKNIEIEEILPKISFEHSVLLKPGKNIINCEVQDVAKNTYSKQEIMILDIQGPVIGIASFNNEHNDCNLKASVYDESGIKTILIRSDDKTLFQKKENQKIVNIDEQFTIGSMKSNVSIIAEDSIGNISEYNIDISDYNQKRLSTLRADSLLASNTFIPSIVKIDNEQSAKPVIQLAGIPEEHDVYLDELWIRVEIFHTKKINNIEMYLNEKIIAQCSSYMIGFNFFQSIFLALDEDKNILRIVVDDGDKTEKKFIINQKEIDNSETMLPIAMIPTNSDQKDSQMEYRLLYWLNKINRFNIMPMRDMDQLKGAHSAEQTDLISCVDNGLDQPPLWVLKWSFEENTSINKAKMAMNKNDSTSLTFKFKDMVELKTQYSKDKKDKKIPSLEINAQIFDYENYNSLITSLYIYGEDVDKHNLTEFVCQGLAQNLFNQFPIVKGMVSNVENNKIFIKHGKNKKIKRGVRLVIYDQVFIRDMLEQDKAFEDLSIISEARIISSKRVSSKALIKKHPNYKTIEPLRHFYVTR